MQDARHQKVTTLFQFLGSGRDHIPRLMAKQQKTKGAGGQNKSKLSYPQFIEGYQISRCLLKHNSSIGMLRDIFVPMHLLPPCTERKGSRLPRGEIPHNGAPRGATSLAMRLNPSVVGIKHANAANFESAPARPTSQYECEYLDPLHELLVWKRRRSAPTASVLYVFSRRRKCLPT